MTILGNTEVEASVPCVWSASVTGGAPPFSYSWTVDGAVIGTGESVTHQSAEPFTLFVTVTDQNSAARQDDHSVAIVSGALCQ